MPYEQTAHASMRAFTSSERILFWFFVLLLVGSTLTLIARVNALVMVDVPRTGGSLTEGVIGSPRFINPLLAVSDADRDLTALVYAGLMRPSETGTLEPELAESYEVTEDGLVYTFALRENATFHDGTPVTADDVIFTVERAQDPALKSPKRANWEGVLVEKIDDLHVQFTLSQPYSPFLENTTLGILPEHIWRSVNAEQFPFSQFNIEPVGAGPFHISDIKRNSAGLPEHYKLKSFGKYVLGKPFLNTITLRFYANEESLITSYQEGDVEALNSISPEHATDLGTQARIERAPLSRIFAVFFNQNQAPVFSDERVRRALEVALDKERLVQQVLEGHGRPIYNPIPPGILTQTTPSYSELTRSERAERALEILQADGWAQNEETGLLEKELEEGVQRLQFTLSTSNTPELKEAAAVIKEEWERLGAIVTIQLFDTADLNTNVIRPRRYNALLFGEIIGRELDLFAFWHSSQRNDPGLNIALYANIITDKLLEDARHELDQDKRLEYYEEFETEVQNETPAVFAYTPDFIYVVPEKLRGLDLGIITTPSDRFTNVHRWYIETNRVWSLFAS
jgi:peptide/nickel transport system substrate-binding protein